MFHLDEEVIVPMMVLAIPIVAIAGGILARIVRTLSEHRLMETAVRERMALVARGVDPARLGDPGLPPLLDARDFARVRAQGLLAGGFVTLVGSATFIFVARSLGYGELGDWGLGVVGGSIGLALILSGLVIWPWRSARAAS